MQQQEGILLQLDSDVAVLLQEDELPADSQIIIDKLRNEYVPLMVWYQIAIGYLRQQNIEAFESILQEAKKQIQIEESQGKIVDIQAVCRIKCTLAIFYLVRKNSCDSSQSDQQQEYEIRYNKLFLEVHEITEEDQIKHYAIGLSYSLQQQTQAAIDEFHKGVLVVQKQLEADPSQSKGLECHFALAEEYIKKREWSIALGILKYILDSMGSLYCPNTVRLYIAYCFINMNKIKRARETYNAALQVAPKCSHTLYGLAVTWILDKDIEKGILKAVEYLCEAYMYQPTNPAVCGLLSRLQLLAGHAASASMLAMRAWNTLNWLTPVSTTLVLNDDDYRLKRDMAAVTGRACQQAGSQYAKDWYTQAIKDDQQNQTPLARLGLAQHDLVRNLIDNGYTGLESIINHHHTQIDILKLAGRLHSQMPRRCLKLLPRFAESMKTHGEDCLLVEQYASICVRQGKNAADCIPLYDKAIICYRKQRIQALQSDADNTEVDLSGLSTEGLSIDDGYDVSWQGVPVECIANAATMHLQAGNIVKANHLIDIAYHMAQQPLDSETYASFAQPPTPDQPQPDKTFDPTFMTQLKFNYARIKYAARHIKVAVTAFRELIDHDPQFTPAKTALAQYALARGDYVTADKLADEILTDTPDHLGALNVKCVILRNDKSDQRAVTQLWKEQIDKRMGTGGQKSVETLGTLYQSNLFLSQMHGQGKQRAAPTGGHQQLDELEQGQVGTKATNGFRKVLNYVDGSNINALHGLACVFAEENMLNTADKAFKKCYEIMASTDINYPAIHVNMANLLLAKRDFAGAIDKYSYALKKFYHNTNDQVLLYLAKAQYSCSNMQDCKLTLLRALRSNPAAHNLWFNIALVNEQSLIKGMDNSNQGLGSKTEGGGISSGLQLPTVVERTQACLTVAKRTYEQLLSMGQEVTGINDKQVKHHIEECQSSITRCARQALIARTAATQSEAKQAQFNQELKARKEKKEQEEREKQMIEEQKKREQERQLAESQSRRQQFLEKIRAEEESQRLAAQAKAAKAKSGKKGVDDFIVDDQQYQSGNEDDLDKARELLAQTGLESSDDERKPQNINGAVDSDDPNRNNNGVDGQPKKLKPKLKRQRQDDEAVQDQDGNSQPQQSDQNLDDDLFDDIDRENDQHVDKRGRTGGQNPDYANAEDDVEYPQDMDFNAEDGKKGANALFGSDSE